MGDLFLLYGWSAVLGCVVGVWVSGGGGAGLGCEGGGVWVEKDGERKVSLR